MMAKMIRPTTILPLPAAASHKFAERLHHAAGRQQAVGPRLGEDQPRGGHVQHQAEQGRGQQQRGKNAEFQRRADVDRRQQHNHGNRDVAGQQQVHQRRGQRHQNHQHAGDNGHRQDQFPQAGKRRNCGRDATTEAIRISGRDKISLRISQRSAARPLF